MVELNHKRNEDGSKQFSQVIVWRWMALVPRSRHVVSDWMVVEPCNVLVLREGNRYRVTWRGSGGMVYDARCYSYRETWTYHDPEMDDRDLYPEKYRVPYFEVKR